MRRVSALLTATFVCAAAVPASAQENLDPGPVMERMIDRYASDRSSLDRFYDLPLSTTRLDRLESHSKKWRAALERVDFDALSADGRVDYILLRNLLDRRIKGAEFERKRDAETRDVLPFASAIVNLEEGRRRLEPLPARHAADDLDRIRKAVDDQRKRVEKGLRKDAAEGAFKTTKVIALRASRRLARLRHSLKGWFEYRDGFEPEFGWWVRTPYAALKKSLEGYEKVLREKVAGVKGSTPPLIGDPIGKQALLDGLAAEHVAYGPEELIAMAEAEFAWCEARGKEAVNDLGLEGDWKAGHESDWKAIVEHVKTLHSAPGEQTKMVEEQAREAIRFVEERKLVTVPDLCKELWRLEMISARRQRTTPFALYGGQAMLVAYATEGMSHESKLMSMRGNNEHFTRIVTPHELVPGHHLQLHAAARHRTHRRIFRTPFLVEGWALHWEMLFWDEGWPRGPEDRVGMLFWRMHRCARVIITLKFHLGQMTPEEMVSFLTDRVGLEEDGARAEVRRYVGETYGPLYQVAYLIGGIQVRSLRKELVESGKMTDLDFHDAVLRENSIPVGLIRARLTGAELTRDTAPTWKFTR